jgi:hypothetical protein
MDYVDDLVTTVEEVSRRLLVLPGDESARRPAPGKWSSKEILGHLIDSAAHNHQRFVQARFQDELVFPGYAQDAWVGAQQYQDAPWPELVALWRSYNLHLARVMRAMPESVRTRSHSRHNLHEIAWQAVPAEQPATLDYFMRDYVAHLKHHLRQIDRLTGALREVAL